MTDHGVTADPDIVHGRPVLRGTRVPVEIVLGSLAAGMTTQDVAREYGLTVAQVFDAVAYASNLVAREEVRRSHAEA